MNSNISLRQDGRQPNNHVCSQIDRGVAAARPLSSRIWLDRLLDWMGDRHQRSQSRRQLLTMSDEQLKDIGLSRSCAFSEATRYFWE